MWITTIRTVSSEVLPQQLTRSGPCGQRDATEREETAESLQQGTVPVASRSVTCLIRSPTGSLGAFGCDETGLGDDELGAVAGMGWLLDAA